jgi:hypothetical protein
MRDTHRMETDQEPASGPEPAPGQDGRGVGLGIAGVTLTFYVAMAAFIVVGMWTILSVYAIVKWIGSATEAPDPTVIVLSVVLLVTLLVTLFAVGIGFLGRSIVPKKRKKAA